MLVTFPALFYFEPEKDGYSEGYSVFFPDFENFGGTCGDTVTEAMYMASDWLGITLADDIENGRKVPTPSQISQLSLVGNNPFKNDEELNYTYDPEKSFISMVSVDVSEYLDSQEPIKKTLTIPKWADKLGREMHLNFSKTLTDAIADKKLNV
ncbi:type II toxin-antitoxin system HicB family antitoxin [Enterococcus sp. BWB1-3]|uniref:type II toxin-antitoxin system HicB family antitoxin n=1 Tax=unclassified Enterococcus TaxID=2608891 RepID=UPI001924A04C|nr:MULTISPECIES: type II toxin-antitoxin system HicB family antitoxin [unclassified Enterococcus]MBL1230126.1 type II toxin-antitoxin system HicB family antitoxin [Enterococcus sp. BWB1-3]MCB5950972.1 type II toxin-antitoxin system HicB family antitoxin [Enterococcus sp. BWT-B8]MCB5955198.1 type II toxin-antitoxin system HicB family antitoxin [Enterococcus sp. CWB-B31]